MDYVGVGGDEHPDRFDAGNDAVPGDTDTDEDLFIAETETLVDTTGFGAKQREINERTNGKFREATERRLPGPFLGSTLHELCESFACATESATPTNVWADVVLALRAREVSSTCNGAVLHPQTARHMKYRATLIEWILEVCADFGFGPTTADLAVQYMDRVLSKVNVPKTSLQLVAMCCLEVAVKYEEVEQDVPSLSKLRKCASDVYSVDIIRKMELAVLIELNWELAHVVSAHFLEATLALTGGGTFPHDDVGDRQWTKECAVQLRKLAGYLHSIVLQDGHVATRHSASTLGAAIVATARLQLGIYPVWPSELRVATGYGCDALGPAMSSILKLYKDALPPVGTGGGSDPTLCGEYGVAEDTAWNGNGDAADALIGARGNTEVDVGIAVSDTTAVQPEPVLQHAMSTDSVFQAIECGNAKYDETNGGREFLTPSPTGPLDAGGSFFEDATMEAC